MNSTNAVKVGPITLAPGISRFNFWTFMYASFICIAMLAGMNFLQPYLLAEHLKIPIDERGTLTGDLAFYTEIIAIVLIVPFGILSDRIGRRPLMIFGMVVIGIGYVLLPIAETASELISYRIFFAVGAAALSAQLPTVGNDYPEERSRGRLFGFSGVLNGLGVIFMSAGLAQIPSILADRGMDPVEAGTAMFFGAAFLCFLSAFIYRIGLKGGAPIELKERPDSWQLFLRGLKSARNPKISLSYAAAFAGRSDNAIKGLFVSLWVLQVAPAAGLEGPAAFAKAGQLMGLMGLVTLVWMPFFGWIIDRINRVSGLALAMLLAGMGFSSMGLIDSPLYSSSIPFFVLLAIGQGSAIVAASTLVGQEAPVKERGTIVATSGMFGAIGILLASVIGGRLFDSIGPHAPFVMTGIFQFVLMFAAITIRFFQGSKDTQIQRPFSS
ncbi:MAG: MFS transporter [Pseudomonadota bacterium]|nr:MFS transporter [Pseudomonadota bacterium]